MAKTSGRRVGFTIGAKHHNLREDSSLLTHAYVVGMGKPFYFQYYKVYHENVVRVEAFLYVFFFFVFCLMEVCFVRFLSQAALDPR